MEQKHFEQLMRAACDYQGLGMQAREKNKETYRRKEPNEQNILRILVDGAIASLTERMKKKIKDTNRNISYQISLVTSYVRTHFLVNDLILHGDLIESITLIRKQLESLTRMHELDAKPFEKLAGKVPNIKNVLKGGAGRIYGDLSEVAHFATPRVGRLLHVFESGELVGPSMLPVYSEQAIACFELHFFVSIYFLIWITDKIGTWYPDYDTKLDRELLLHIVLVAKDAKVIREEEDADGS